METFFASTAVLLVVIIALPLYRVLRGPTVFDRMLAIGAIGSKTIGLIVLFGIGFRRLEMFVDIALAYAVLNFIGGIAVAKYLTVTAKTNE